MERRELFSSFFSSGKAEEKELVIRPPYFIDRDSFDKECIGCEDTPCITFCEENIIILDKQHTPAIDFKLGGCTYCDDCASHCPKEVLTVQNKSLFDVSVEINMLGCVSWRDTMCFSCKDPCLEDAIEFLGIYKPSINSEKCTGCGFCISRCPTDAIILKEKRSTNGS